MFKFLSSHWWGTFVVFFFPLIVMYIYSDFVRESELNARLGWLIMIGGLAYLLRHTLLQKFLILLLALFVVSGSLDILYAITFGGLFTSASFEALIETDKGEGIDFFIAYAGLENLLILSIYLILSFMALRQLMIKAPVNIWRKVAIFLGILMLIFAIQQVDQRGRTFDVIPGFAGKAIDYTAGRESIDILNQRRLQNFNNAQFTATKSLDEPHTLVIVIGESMNRNHMSLYGYTRPTTPNLDAMQDELIIYSDTISSHTQTRPSLSVALTEVNTSNIDQSDQVMSLMEVYKKAGYNTWWISNQQPLRYPTTPIAALADHVHFISHDFYGVSAYRYDGYMTPYINKALEDPSPHKVIFVHLMGSHLRYESRYPADTSTRFSNKEGIQAYIPADELSGSQIDAINHYDNSIYYTDSLLKDWISKLNHEAGNTPAAMIYFADHGEEVFDSKNFKGHAPDGVTRHMLEVPLLVWRNNAYQQIFNKVDNAMTKKANTPFMLDDFFHFSICVAAIETDLYNPQKSACDIRYKPQERLIYGKFYKELLD